MSRDLLLLVSSLLFAMGLGACKSPCDRSCEILIRCHPELVESFSSEDLDCRWADKMEMREQCLEECQDEYDDYGGDEREAFAECLDCTEDKVEDGCGELSRCWGERDACSEFRNDSSGGDGTPDWIDAEEDLVCQPD